MWNSDKTNAFTSLQVTFFRAEPSGATILNCALFVTCPCARGFSAHRTNVSFHNWLRDVFGPNEIKEKKRAKLFGAVFILPCATGYIQNSFAPMILEDTTNPLFVLGRP